MKESDDQEVQGIKKCFGNKIPTPEEYIYKTSKSIIKKIKF